MASRDTDTLLTTSLLDAPALRDPARLQTESAVTFQLLPGEGATIVRGLVAADAGMTDPIAEAETATDTLVFEDLPEGRWFIRLTGLSADGLEGRGRSYDFIRARNGVSGLALARGAHDGLRTYRFGWRGEGEGEALFRFQLWMVDASGQQVGPVLYDQPALSESSYTLTGLLPGDYAWRVQGTRFRFGHRLSAWSDTERLTISN